MTTYDASFCRDIARSSHTEWLETNGIGGYAAGTVAGIPTRRYHALLVASMKPPTHRVATLMAMHETFDAEDGESYSLSAFEYDGATHPTGYLHLVRFSSKPTPTWRWRLPNGSEIRRELALAHGENTVAMQYTLTAGPGGVLRLRPRLVCRDYHSLRRRDDGNHPVTDVTPRRLTVSVGADIPELVIRHDADNVDEHAIWYYGVRYSVELERGQDYVEDHLSPAELTTTLGDGRDTVSLVATLGGDADTPASAILDDEARRRSRLGADVEIATGMSDAARAGLAEAAARVGDYVVRRGDRRRTILAGYPWFADWGRDTMIALPGLTLAVGGFDAAREIIDTYALHCADGLIPNRFPDAGEEPEYNTADATLWFVEAVRRYAEANPRDSAAVDGWLPLLRDIIDRHRRGTRHNIHVAEDGLLHAGEGSSQLTWMDAKTGDWAATPRVGKPVEINALWYSALRAVQGFARAAGDDATEAACAADADRARESFRRRFVNPHTGGLYDVVDSPDGDDATIRPNQIIAVSLHHRMLDNDAERAVVDVVRRRLLTPVGLRSLAPNHPAYSPVYRGSPAERDASYHQGPVWGWLWGPYYTALGNAYGRDEQYRETLLAALATLFTRRDVRGVGGLAEIYDGREPHAARGCPWQAWSVAEVLRVAWEEGLLARR